MKKMNIAIVSVLIGLFATPVAQATDVVFLKLDGIKGESKDKSHPDEILVATFKLSVSQPELKNSVGSGASAAKSQFAPIVIYKYIDKASVPLLAAASAGKLIKSATLQVAHTDEAGQATNTYYTVTLHNVYIASVNEGNDTVDGNGNILETITLAYSQIQWTIQPFNSDGNPEGQAVTGSFDVNRNKLLIAPAP